LAKEFEPSDGTYAVELHHVLADDDHVVRCCAAPPSDGKTLDLNYVLVFHTAAARSPRLKTVERPGSARRILDEDVDIA
jgi:hypothetical protein